MRLSLDKKQLIPAFLLCLALFLTVPVIDPQLSLTFFAPFLIIAIYKKPLASCLWIAFICGVILDSLSSFSHFGIYTLDYCLTLFLLYPQKRNFFADNVSTLPIMTFFFSVISTLILAFLIYVVEIKNITSLPWVLTDLILMPTFDSLYAFLCFTLPSLFFGQTRRRGKDYFN